MLTINSRFRQAEPDLRKLDLGLCTVQYSELLQGGHCPR